MVPRGVMSYDSVRMIEHAQLLDHSIDDFIDQYNFNTRLSIVAGLNPARPTLFPFPGVWLGN
jgi:hypothetical protein